MKVAFAVSFGAALFAFLPSLVFASADCEKIKNNQQRLACYDSNVRNTSSGGVVAGKACRSFESASNALKASLEGGTLRYDMLASGVSELIAMREECRRSTKSATENRTYETNIHAFQDIFQAVKITNYICKTDPIASVLSNCSPQTVPLSSGGITYGCQEFFRPIPRHDAWIKQNCKGKVSNLISHILTQEVTVY